MYVSLSLWSKAEKKAVAASSVTDDIVSYWSQASELHRVKIVSKLCDFGHYHIVA